MQNSQPLHQAAAVALSQNQEIYTTKGNGPIIHIQLLPPWIVQINQIISFSDFKRESAECSSNAKCNNHMHGEPITDSIYFAVMTGYQ